MTNETVMIKKDLDHSKLEGLGYIFVAIEGGYVSGDRATTISIDRKPYIRQVMQYSPNAEKEHAENVEKLKQIDALETPSKKKEPKMIYGLEMNLHQVDQHTIQAYVLNAEHGMSQHAPVTFESPLKHPTRTKASGEPYAREHGSMFNILKTQLIHEGKWKVICNECKWVANERQKTIVENGTKFCPVCDNVLVD